MLASTIITARVVEPAGLDRHLAPRLFLGRAAQAILLDRVSAADADLGASLHEGSGPRPYSVGVALQPPFSPDDPWRVRLRISLFQARLAQLLSEILERLPSARRFDDLSAEVEAIARAPSSDRDVGETSYQEILNRRLLVGVEPDPRIELRFVSPTTFHYGERNHPIPLPGLVFGNLVERWNAFSPLTLHPDARRYAEECLAITRFRIESRVVDLAGGKQIGAIGAISYRSLRPDPYWLRLLHALADFAFYSGVGAKTTMGLGQTRREA